MNFKRESLTVFADWKLAGFVGTSYEHFKKIFEAGLNSKYCDGALFEKAGFALLAESEVEERLLLALLNQMALVIEERKPEYSVLVGVNDNREIRENYACIELLRKKD